MAEFVFSQNTGFYLVNNKNEQFHWSFSSILPRLPEHLPHNLTKGSDCESFFFLNTTHCFVENILPLLRK